MVVVLKWQVFQLFFLGNIDQENVFYDILEQKNAFLGHKNKKFKKELLPRKAFFRFRISKKTFSWPIFPIKKVGKPAIFIQQPLVNPF